MRRTHGSLLALVAAAIACDCGGSGIGDLWMGEAGAPRILSFTERGEVAVAAEAPALDAPVRAMAVRGDGAIIVLQEVEAGAPPAVVLSPAGRRLATFAASVGGAPIFPPATPPWAATQATDGRIWVTGRREPAIFLADGSFDGFAAALPGSSAGVAALPDGRVLVTYGANGAAVYSADGATLDLLVPDLSTDPAFRGLDAVAARPDGSVVVAVMHHGAVVEGAVVEAVVETGRLTARGDAAASARLSAPPSSLVLGDDFVVAGPSLGPAATPGCVEVLSPDLATRYGCVTPGVHRGVARLR